MIENCYKNIDINDVTYKTWSRKRPFTDSWEDFSHAKLCPDNNAQI